MLIKHKLPLAAVVLTLFTAGATSIAAITVAGKQAEAIYKEDLAAVADGRRNELQLYLSNIRLDLQSLASRPDTTEALKAFTAGWEEVGDGVSDRGWSVEVAEMDQRRVAVVRLVAPPPGWLPESGDGDAARTRDGNGGRPDDGSGSS